MQPSVTASATHLVLDKTAFSRISQIFQPQLVVPNLRSPNEDFYAPQTKVLEGRINRPEHLFDALFKGLSTRFGLRIVEKCIEKMFRTVYSAFQNLRLGSIILEEWTKDEIRIFEALFNAS